MFSPLSLYENISKDIRFRRHVGFNVNGHSHTLTRKFLSIPAIGIKNWIEFQNTQG